MNDDPFRLRVLKALTDALKGINPDNGYIHDLRDETLGSRSRPRVYRGRDEFGNGDPLPMVSVLESPSALDPAQKPNDKASYGAWELLIQGFVEDDPLNPTDPAYHLEAEVRAALAKEKVRRDNAGRPNILGLGNGYPSVDKIDIGQPVVRPGDGVNSTVAFFWLSITLHLVEDLEEPFA